MSCHYSSVGLYLLSMIILHSEYEIIEVYIWKRHRDNLVQLPSFARALVGSAWKGAGPVWFFGKCLWVHSAPFSSSCLCPDIAGSSWCLVCRVGCFYLHKSPRWSEKLYGKQWLWCSGWQALSVLTGREVLRLEKWNYFGWWLHHLTPLW